MFQVTATAIEIGKTHVSLSVYLLPILYVNNLPQQPIRGMTPQVPSYLTQLLTFSTPNFFLFVLVLDVIFSHFEDRNGKSRQFWSGI